MLPTFQVLHSVPGNVANVRNIKHRHVRSANLRRRCHPLDGQEVRIQRASKQDLGLFEYKGAEIFVEVQKLQGKNGKDLHGKARKACKVGRFQDDQAIRFGC